MATRSARPQSSRENLRAAICLLALSTSRPPDLDEILAGTEKCSAELTETPEVDSLSAVSLSENELADVVEGLENFDRDEEVDEVLSPMALKDKVLDRLAEVLARFKTDRRWESKNYT